MSKGSKEAQNQARLVSMKSVSELRELVIFTPKPVKTGLIWYPGYCQQRSKAYMLVNYLVND